MQRATKRGNRPFKGFSQGWSPEMVGSFVVSLSIQTRRGSTIVRNLISSTPAAGNYREQIGKPKNQKQGSLGFSVG